MIKLLFSMLFIFPLIGMAQLSDDFSDADFITSPAWTGDQAQFSVNSSLQLQLASSGENISYLSTAVTFSDSTEWDLWVKLAFSPSDNNNARIYLVSDQSDLKGLLKGYYLKLGEAGSSDAIELYRQNGKDSNLICRGTEGLLANSFAVRIRVIRSAIGFWKIFADPAGGHDFQPEASGSDNNFSSSGFFGIFCKYTGSNSTKFYFDDFYAGPVIILNEPDTNIPVAFDVLISEIMADPVPAAGLPQFEYVELFNRSAYPVNLAGWNLRLGSSVKELSSLILQPKAYLIMADEDARQALSSYGQFAGCPDFTVLNTGTDLLLLDAHGGMIHNVGFTDSWYGDDYKRSGGWSLELIDPENPCGDASNWKASVAIAGGTPGRLNSVNAINPDLKAPQIQRVNVDDSVRLTVYFTEMMDSLILKNPEAYLIDNQAGQFVAAVPHFPDYKAVTLFLVQPLIDKVVYTLSLAQQMKDCAGNLTTSENNARFAIPSIAAPSDIVLNEVLFDPKGNGADFVELYNRSSKVLDLRNLTLANIDTLTNTLISVKNITDQGFLFFPGSYIVLSANPDNVKSDYYTPDAAGFLKMESLPPLNNENGTIALAHKNSELIDWLAYDAAMHFAMLKSVDGVSLERISASRASRDRSNWHSAAETVGFATPAYQNSQSSVDPEGGNPLALSPDIFSPDNDGNNDILNIAYTFDAPGYMANISVFDASGRLIRSLVNNEMCGISGAFSWDGLTNDRRKAGIGYYLIYTEIFDLKGLVKHYKNTAVLGGKL